MLDNKAMWAASESSESPNPNLAQGTKMAGAGPVYTDYTIFLPQTL